MATTSSAAPPPPPYTRSSRPSRPPPEVTILILGSPGVGKSTFLAALPRVRDGRLQKSFSGTTSTTGSHKLNEVVPNPSSFSVTLFNRPYNIVIHRSESTLFIDPFPEKINFVILCYAVDSRESLYNCQFYWRKQFADRYERELGLVVPVMLVGLKRDLRTGEMRKVEGAAAVADFDGRDANSKGHNTQEVREQYVCVMPEEGLRAASEMRCDKYAECSAHTGDLMWEVLEDITRTAALTTTEKGGLSEGNCGIM